METLRTKKSKFLVILIVFMLLFSNFGYTIAAIATSDEFEVISKGFFQKDEIKFNSYFVDANGKKIDEITENVNGKVKLVVEVLPQVEGYLKSATLRAVSSDDDNLNFKFTSVTENLLKESQTTLNDVFVSDEEETENNGVLDVLVPDDNENTEEPTNKVEENTVPDTAETNTVVDGTNTVSENTVSENTNTTQDSLLDSLVGEEVNSGLLNPLTGVGNSAEGNTVESNPLVDALQEGEITNPLAEEPKAPAEEPEAPAQEQSAPEQPVSEPEVMEEDILIDEEAPIEEVSERARLEELIRNAILDIKLASENEIALSNIIGDTKFEIELEYNQGEKFNVADLYKNVKLQLSGTYINRNLEEVPVAKEEEVTVGWEYTKDITLESEYTKISPFELEEVKGTIVENKITIARDITDEKYLPVKSTRLEIVAPKVNGKNPIAADVIANKLLATKGEDYGNVVFEESNWKYDNVNGTVNVFVENYNNVYSKGLDEYVIIYRYEDYIDSENSNLSNNIRATVTEYSGKENNTIIKEIKDEQDVKVDVGELVTYSIGTNEGKINKGKIYANYNSEVPVYETLFKNQVNVNILTSDVLQQLKIDCTKEVYKDAAGVELEAQGIEYKEIKFNYSEVSLLLSEGGEIVITNSQNETLYVLNKDVITKEEDCTVNLNGANGIYLYVNNISKNGSLNFELTKAIKKCNYGKSIFKSITQIESRISAEVKYQNIEERIALQTIAVAKDFEESKTSATLSINRDSLSTLRSNDNVELKVELNNDKETSDLYINPSFEIVFPKYVTGVSIESINLLNECGLRVGDFETYTESDIVKLRIDLTGTQTMFSENTSTNGTNIVINANIQVDEYTPAKQDQVKLYYCNEGVATYQSQTKWAIKKNIPNGILKSTNGFDAQAIKYQAPTGLIAINGIVNYDGNLSEVRSVKQGDVTKEIPINAPSRIATMELLALNNTENVCSDIVLIGRTAFKGNTDVISNEDLGTTTDTKVIDKIKEDVQNGNTAKIYYSTNPTANKDLEDKSNGWTEEITDLASIKSYMIVIEGDVAAGSVLRYTYDFEIPENLPYEAKITGSFGAYYNNSSDVAVVYESSSADHVSLSTEKGPSIEAKLSVDIGDGTEVGECRYITYTLDVANIGSITASNVDVSVDTPEYASVCKYTDNNGYGNNQYSPSSEKKVSWKISNLEAGQKESYQFIMKTKELPTIEEYNAKLIGKAVFKDEKGYYYIEKIKDENTKETIEKRVYIDDIKDTSNLFVTAKGKVEASNLGIAIYSNEINNKLVDSNFDMIVNTTKPSPIIVGDRTAYTAAVKNISGKDLKNVTATWILPYNVEFLKPEDDDAQFQKNVDWIYDETTRTATKTFPEFNIDENKDASLRVQVMNGNIEPLTNYLTMKTEEGITEKSSDITRTYTGSGIDTNQTCNISNGTVLEGEEVEFVIQIKNNGNGDGKNIIVSDEISPNLEDVTAKSSVFGRVLIDNGQLTYRITNLPAGSSDYLTITGTAADLNGEVKSIINKANISYNVNDRTETNEIRLEIQENAERRQQLQQANNNHYNNQTTTNNDNNNSNNQSNGNKYTRGTKSISGNVWLDKDRNGKKDNNETAIASIPVHLYKGDSMIQSTSTNKSGKYTFKNLSEGDYYIVFEYDANKYAVTEYQKANVEAELNSNAVETASGNATTGTITIGSENISNVNLGLQEKTKFDLTIEKVITKATVITDKKQEVTNFNDEILAKVEIRASELKKSKVDLEYKINIINSGDAQGKATTIIDVIPDGMKFEESRNPGWVLGSDGILYNNSLKDVNIAPGEKKELKLILTKNMTEENTGAVSNKTQILATETSTELLENTENNVATQQMLILIKTGGNIQYVLIVFLATIFIIGIYYNRSRITTIVNSNKNIYKNKEKDRKKISIKKKYK